MCHSFNGGDLVPDIRCSRGSNGKDDGSLVVGATKALLNVSPFLYAA